MRRSLLVTRRLSRLLELCGQAQILARQGKLEEAKAVLTKAMELKTTRIALHDFDDLWHDEVALTQGLISERAGDLSAAAAAYSSIKALPYGSSRLAAILLALGRTDDARIIAVSMLDAGPSATACRVLAEISERQGDTLAALNWYLMGWRQLVRDTDWHSSRRFLPAFFMDGPMIRSGISRLLP